MDNKNPIQIHIHIGKNEAQFKEMLPVEKVESNIEKALRMVGEVKKVHPDAMVYVEVEE